MKEPKIFSPQEFKINHQNELDFESDYKKLYAQDDSEVCLYV